MARAYATVNTMFNRNISNVAANLAGGKPEKEKKPRAWIAKFSKEQILEMRTKHELEGWPRKKVQEHFGMTYNETARYLNYITARDLVPKRP